jgi:hypothetical protein
MCGSVCFLSSIQRCTVSKGFPSVLFIFRLLIMSEPDQPTTGSETPGTRNSCAICLSDEPKNITRPDAESCLRHLFCFECIWTWVQASTSCPLCRQHIAFLTTLDKVTGAALYRVCIFPYTPSDSP